MDAETRLFDNLAALERLAVLMCEKHEAVAGQLEDERRHERLFRQLGSGASTIEPIQDLTDWCASLEGGAQIAILNLVAEVWVEEILFTLGALGPAQHRELFLAVSEDEERHCAAEPPVLDAAAPYVRTLERHLHAIASDPRFMWPLCHLLGVEAVTYMSVRLHEAHAEALSRLGVSPGEHFGSLLACRAEAERDQGVEPVELDVWRQSAFNLDLQPMVGFREIDWHWSEDPAEVEARFTRAIHRTLAFEPQLNRTINIARKELYAPNDCIVGVRRPGVVTAYVKPCEDLETLGRHIRLKARQARVAAVVIPEIDDGLLALQPPPRAAATLSCHMGLGGITYGLAPMSRIEGATWSVGVGGEIIDGRLTVGVLADHRAFDGTDLCTFLNHLAYQLGVPNG